MSQTKKRISVVTPCFNEEGNIAAVYQEVKKVFEQLPQYDYEHLFIDNDSNDSTLTLLRGFAANDKHVKVIVNARNFGPVRSPYYGLLQADGDAVILFVADLQDPPELIPRFIEAWEKGSTMAIGVKNKAEESRLMFQARKFYYRLVNRLADLDLVQNFTGFGLYDRTIISLLRSIDDPDPYLRGLVCYLGFEKAIFHYTQPVRKVGKSNNNFYDLFDTAMLGITSHSKVPLRLATFVGIILSIISFIAAFVYFIMKLVMWDSFSIGMAPLVIGLFLISGVQMIFIGLIGEYIASIQTRVFKRPLVVEKERINFD